MPIHDHASIPAEIFNPYDSPKAALFSPPLDARITGPMLASSFPAPARSTRSPKVPAHPVPAACTDANPSDAASRHDISHASQRAPPIAHIRVDAKNGEENKDSDVHSSPSTTPPPVPPKSPIHDRRKSVSILVPTDISPAKGVSSHSQSDFRHSYRDTVNSAATSPESAPTDRTVITSLHVSPNALADDTLSSFKAPHVRPSMEPSTRKASSVRARRNKLHKPRQHSLPSLPLGSSLFSSLLSRAFGSHDAFHDHSRSSSGTSMSDRSYRPTRSASDGGHVGTKRPSPSSRSSDLTDSSCTTSSSGSTSLSYASTALTTPDSTSPSLSPHNSTRSVRTNKLHKRRPPSSPSAASQYPPGSYRSVLGRSKSTPSGLGQRVERSRNWSSVDEARHAAEEAESLAYGPDPTSWYPPSTDPSPSRRSTLDPIFEVRRKGSSRALAQLACTGLCSSSVAALSSQIALQAELSDRLSTLNGHSWDEHGVDQFNPYVECTSPPELESGDSSPQRDRDSPTSSSGPLQPDSNRNTAEESSSGFAVVSGYLDRSEDAMRRWTLAMADVPDEVLVQHLERLRKESMALARGHLPGRRSAAPSQVGHGDEESTMDTRVRRSSFFFGGPREMGISSPRSPSRAHFSVGHDDRELDGDDSDDEALSEEDDEEDWKTARQVLFCCRELVQTERNYQARLRELATTELSCHYSSLVANYVPALLRVSETLLTHLVDDPSAWGVSAAFIGCEEELEAAFVAWSGVVGEFFVEDAQLKPTRKLTKKLLDETLSNHGHDSPAPSMRMNVRTRSQGAMSPMKRDSMAGRRLSSTMSDVGHGGEASSSIGHGTGMFTAALGTGLAFGLSVPQSPPSFDSDFSPGRPSQARSLHGHGNRANASSIGGLTRAVTAVNAWKRKSMPSSLSHLPSLVGSATSPASPHSPGHHQHHHNHHHHHSSSASAHGHGHGHGKKHSEHDKMTVRDLAIQPTQRVMRYVLQYRDLLDHTPTTSPSRALVERAYEIALRIAKKCDRAQAHAAFLRQQHQK
ncbi:hypothetical protein GY45DRAFT_1242607 [Cubamyces sp. BRFM 1775]|nr:hypothetical protein GY45DRAFT_1242607 [Cubamyces sp. BRFM 1775]